MTRMATMRKTVLITGASSGLGAEMARQLAASAASNDLKGYRSEFLELLNQARNLKG